MPTQSRSFSERLRQVSQRLLLQQWLKLGKKKAVRVPKIPAPDGNW